jgi:hypothetical protein
VSKKMQYRTKKRFESFTQESIDAIELCLQEKLRASALILLYSAMDTMAWLHRPQNHVDVTRADFVAWTSKYVLPGSGLACSAEDLYGARCGLLHSHTVESRLSRKGTAKELLYSWGTADPKILQEAINRRGSSAIPVRIEDLLEALRLGIERFKQDLLSDPQRTKLVSARFEKVLKHLPLSQ